MELPIDMRWSGNEHAMAIVEIEIVVIHQFDFDVLVVDLKL